MRILPVHLILASSLLSAGVVGCKSAKIKPTQGNVDLSSAVAKVDDTVIDVGDVQERINKQSPFIRSRYTTVDKKKEFLDNLIRFEVMAKEAQKRGYDKDPEVIRVMKQQMISKFLQKDFESKLKVEDVPEPDVEKYYNGHPDEFNQKDQVRVSQILVKDKPKADKVLAEVKASPKLPAGTDQQKPFRDLVTKYSEDEDSKARGGDLLFLDKDSTQVPRPVVEAAFALKEVGDVSAPIKSEKGFHILKLTQKRPGFSRPLPEVKRQIQQRLFRDIRTKALDDFYAEMKKKTTVEVFEANLEKVVVDTTGAEGGGGPGPGGMPGMPGMPGNPHGGGMKMPGGPAVPPPAPHKP
jgi:peptidyl-prolyl cis-trans isomerase C